MFDKWLDLSAFMPHGFCMRWDPSLLATMVVANCLIAFAYFSIPIALLFFVGKRQDIAFPWMFRLFGLFIISCGTTHLIKILTIYHAAYWLEALMDLFTGVVSMLTAILLWKVIPKALQLASPGQLQKSNMQLMESMEATKRLNEELSDLNEQLRVARDQAVESSNLKSGFVATISHELRTPLAGILGLNELLLSSRLDKEQEQLSKSIQEAGHSLLQIVNDILDISKLEAGKLGVEVAPIAVRQMMNECLDVVSPSATRKKLTLKSKMDPQLDQTLFGDNVRLKQILINLLGNAVKFTDQGEVELRAEFVSADQAEIKTRFIVRDTGIGIAQQDQERIFQPFTQVDQSTSRRYGGTGLGLNICTYLSELVGGRISVESEIGKGSSFILELPLQISAGESTVAAVPELNSGLLRARVLVVEDDPFLQQLANKQLIKLGSDPKVARNADEALEFLAHNKFDMIFMDCHMPGIDGYALTGMIRKSDLLKNIPIVAMTAGAMIGDYQRCMVAGMDDYLSKPYTLKQLEDMLRKWAGKDAASLEAAAVTLPERHAEQVLRSAGVPAIDLEKLRTAYGAEGSAEIIETFFSTSYELLSDLHTSLAASDADQIRQYAHRLKGASSMAFMDPIFRCCIALETKAKETDWTAIESEIDELKILMDEANDLAQGKLPTQ